MANFMQEHVRSLSMFFEKVGIYPVFLISFLQQMTSCSYIYRVYSYYSYCIARNIESNYTYLAKVYYKLYY